MNRQSERPPAVIVMSDLPALARQHRLITDIAERGMAPLVVVGPVTDLPRLTGHMADSTHPLSRIATVRQLPDAAVDGVLASVQDWIADYDVRGVICSGEVFVDPVGVLCEVLGLPGAGTWAARVCRNKVMQRVILRDHGPVSRAFAPHERENASSEVYPCVVKPAGRMFSSGVLRVDDDAELRASLAAYEPDETILVEELVVGPEFSVEALVHQGEVVWSGVTAKLTNEDSSRYFTEIGHTSPAKLPLPHTDALVSANAAILKALRFDSGITHAEFRLRDGQPVLMEVAARLPGDAITMLWHLATGKPIEPAIVDLALGIRPDYPCRPGAPCSASSSTPPGRGWRTCGARAPRSPGSARTATGRPSSPPAPTPRPGRPRSWSGWRPVRPSAPCTTPRAAVPRSWSTCPGRPIRTARRPPSPTRSRWWPRSPPHRSGPTAQAESTTKGRDMVVRFFWHDRQQHDENGAYPFVTEVVRP
ncbi:acetyl-CoA carboxylase biotin carboxylase subunit family protein [Streptomyces sp. CBG33]|uniref:ATP-grasp domain-containing protein n=1 Tax=Streptomyces sp. CBG33 TaxID=2762624 RepID=UPI0021BDA0A5|nr:ATP-grasp domain-containing protein [Streptomyces sp. CBG33]